MTDKVQKIREEVEMVVNRRLNLLNGEYFDLNEEVNGFTKEIIDIIDSLQEEPVSEELEEASRNYADNEEYGDDVYFAIKAAFKAGAKWQKENLWKPADGDDLPEYEREVVVFTQNYPDDAGIMSVAIGHRPNPDGWDGKSLTTGKVEHYTPKTYGKGGWNIPDVKWWLDCLLPNMED